MLLLSNALPLRILKSDSGYNRWGFKIIPFDGGVKPTLGEESFILKERLRFRVPSRLVWRSTSAWKPSRRLAESEPVKSRRRAAPPFDEPPNQEQLWAAAGSAQPAKVNGDRVGCRSGWGCSIFEWRCRSLVAICRLRTWKTQTERSTGATATPAGEPPSAVRGVSLHVPKGRGCSQVFACTFCFFGFRLWL